MNFFRLGLVVSTLLFLGACSPRFLVDSYFIPQTDKIVRATKAKVGVMGGDSMTVNYYLQVCDINNGTATNCKSTLILDNVLMIRSYNY